MVSYLLIIQFQESHICSICLNMVPKSIRRLNRVEEFMDLWKFMLLLGGIINIFSGFVTLVWPEVFRKISYHFGDNNFAGYNFDPRSNLLLGIFSSGVIMAFGGGYLYTYFWEPQNLSLLVLGIVVRCWAFISSLYCFLKKNISLQLFIFIGLEAMLFA